MKGFLNKIYQNHALVYKVLLFIVTTVVIVYLFPKGVYFKYDIQKGKVWHNEDLTAPFDFAIQKTDDEIKLEKNDILINKHLYFKYSEDVKNIVLKNYEQKARVVFSDTITGKLNEKLLDFGRDYLINLYSVGITENIIPKDKIVTILKGNEAFDVLSNKILLIDDIRSKVQNNFKKSKYYENLNDFEAIITSVVKANVVFDENYTSEFLEKELKNISTIRGKISAGDLIISNGKSIDDEYYSILSSLRNEYNSKSLSDSNYYWLILGYVILVSIVLVMLLLFLKKYRLDIYENNNKVTFIFFNIFLMVLFVTITIKYAQDFIIAVPLIVLPIIIKAFFDSRLGLITHVLTVLLLGFIVPNSFEFIFLQIITGIVTILTVSELYKRTNLLYSIGQITLIYMLAYFAFYIIQEGDISNIKARYFALFALNGILAFFLSHFLILIYEKLFGLVSDVSLLELSNTNSKLLRELNEKSPGTFQHSMQVANLAEASANEIGANAMLVRTGALYHDIGKMLNPMFFTENQSTNINPHNELTPKDSAQIIINHIIGGIELAKKNGLPERIIDFIRTHHGTSLVYYFYKQQEELFPDDLNEDDFRYPGPIPFSKETAILMMADASEAASKSLKEPTAQSIDNLIDKVINGQMNNGQFMNADITFKEIQIIKKVIKKKLNNIYHLRIEYPE